MSALIVNLFGPPGAGKSTGAAYIFSKLKLAGINAELVTEVAKDKTWENNTTALDNQAYIFGEQFYRMSRCEDKVDVIVTDSPILLSIIYNHNNRLGDAFNEMVTQVSNSYNSINVIVNRVKPYHQIGRNQTEEQSISMNNEIRDLCYNITSGQPIIEVDGNEDGYDTIVEIILKTLKECWE